MLSHSSLLNYILPFLRLRSERKKVLRKISQVKNDLEAASENRSACAKEAATQLENTLFELRVDLNYILVCFIMNCGACVLSVGWGLI